MLIFLSVFYRILLLDFCWQELVTATLKDRTSWSSRSEVSETLIKNLYQLCAHVLIIVFFCHRNWSTNDWRIFSQVDFQNWRGHRLDQPNCKPSFSFFLLLCTVTLMFADMAIGCEWNSWIAQRLQQGYPHYFRDSFEGHALRSFQGLHYATRQHDLRCSRLNIMKYLWLCLFFFKRYFVH